MKKIVYMLSSMVALFTIVPDIYASKAGAAIGGFIGGTLVGSALSRPRDCYYPCETVVVHEPAPVVVASGSNRLRREIQELRDDNNCLRDENRNLNRENKQLQQENDSLQAENLSLQKDNKQFQKENLGLEQELLSVKKELTKLKETTGNKI